MKQSDFTFQRDVKSQNNAPAPRIRIPMSVVQKIVTRKGWYITSYKLYDYAVLNREKNSDSEYFDY